MAEPVLLEDGFEDGVSGLDVEVAGAVVFGASDFGVSDFGAAELGELEGDFEALLLGEADAFALALAFALAFALGFALVLELDVEAAPEVAFEDGCALSLFTMGESLLFASLSVSSTSSASDLSSSKSGASL